MSTKLCNSLSKLAGMNLKLSTKGKYSCDANSSSLRFRISLKIPAFSAMNFSSLVGMTSNLSTVKLSVRTSQYDVSHNSYCGQSLELSLTFFVLAYTHCAHTR